MKRIYSLIFFVIVLFVTVGCTTVSTSGNYTLQSGKTIRGNLVITSGNVTLEEASRVTGDVFITSGNLEANGEVDGNILMTSGNVLLGPEALVKGNITTTSGEVSQAEGSQVGGQISTNQSTFTFGGGFFARLCGLFCLLPLLVISGLIILLVALVRRKRTAVSEETSTDETATLKLKQLKQMLDEGLITEAEYEAKKADILANL